MNDILITSKQIKREILTFLFCFLIAFASNVYAILNFRSPATELYSSLHYVLLFSLLLYALWSLLRIIFHFISRIIRK